MASFRGEGPYYRFEKRKDYRFEVQLPVQLGNEEDDLSSICTNLSWKGLSVETAQILGVAERLAVTVTIAPKQEPLRMLGQVVWKREMAAEDPFGQPIREIGIRFLRPLPSAWNYPDDSEFDSDFQEGPEMPEMMF